jgi:hypothetical protein
MTQIPFCKIIGGVRIERGASIIEDATEIRQVEHHCRWPVVAMALLTAAAEISETPAWEGTATLAAKFSRMITRKPCCVTPAAPQRTWAMTPMPLPVIGGTTCLLLLAICAQSTALARGGGLPQEAPWSAEHLDRLPPEVLNSVLRMCRARPDAGQYFATYLDHSRIIKLHFEYFHCEGEQQMYRDFGLCLREEFTLSGSRYRKTRSYYSRCDD